MDDNLLKNFMNELGEDYDSKSYEKYKELEDLLFMKNGKALIYSSRIKYELMSLRRHSLDFGYEELNSKEIEFFEEEIRIIRECINLAEYEEAASRIACLQAKLGLSIKLKTEIYKLVKGIKEIPAEFDNKSFGGRTL